MPHRPNEKEDLRPVSHRQTQFEPTFLRGLWRFLVELGGGAARTVGRSTLIALMVAAPMIHALTVWGGVLTILKVGECPYDAVGEPAWSWYVATALFLVYLGALVVALVCFSMAVLGRKPEPLRTDLTAQPLRLARGIRLDATLIVHPVLTVFAVALLYITYAAGLGYAVFDFAGNRCRWVHSDLGAERRAHNQEHIVARNISDEGLEWIARGGVARVRLTISEAPEITPVGLAAFAKMPETTLIEFRAHGSQREWGDAEAALIARTPALERLELHDFGRLTDAWLYALPERCPALRRIVIRASPQITEEQVQEFQKLYPEVKVSVSPSLRPDPQSEDR